MAAAAVTTKATTRAKPAKRAGSAPCADVGAGDGAAVGATDALVVDAGAADAAAAAADAGDAAGGGFVASSTAGAADGLAGDGLDVAAECGSRWAVAPVESLLSRVALGSRFAFTSDIAFGSRPDLRSASPLRGCAGPGAAAGRAVTEA